MPPKLLRRKRPAAARTKPPAAGKIRVVIIDDHPLCRAGLRQVIENDSRLEFAGEAGTRESGVSLVLQEKPDVAIIDISPAGIGGLEMACLFSAKKSPTRLVALASVADEQLFNRALNVGISGYVLKTGGSAKILNCVVTVATGRAFVTPTLTDFLLSRRGRIDFLELGDSGLKSLTPAERRIIQRIAEGKTSRLIASELSISKRTVETHRTNIAAKLQLKGPNCLLQFALEHRDALSNLA
jgi:DNA-binding NarL/FixJ family response regulator